MFCKAYYCSLHVSAVVSFLANLNLERIVCMCLQNFGKIDWLRLGIPLTALHFVHCIHYAQENVSLYEEGQERSLLIFLKQIQYFAILFENISTVNCY